MLSDPQKRPIYLNLFQFHFPITAILSISHRITGVLILALLPLYVFLLQQSLTDEAAFMSVAHLMSSNAPLKILSIIFFTALALHVYAGIRHIIMDFGIGESLAAARLSTWIVFVLTGIKLLSLSYFFFVVIA